MPWINGTRSVPSSPPCRNRALMLLLLGTLPLGMAGCDDEPTRPRSGPPPEPPRFSKPNAGLDEFLPLPSDSLTLRGSVKEAEWTPITYRWSKVSGPDSFWILSPPSRETVVTGLRAGRYEFELRAGHAAGWSDADTVAIDVYDPRASGINEVVVSGFEWKCMMGCHVRIRNALASIPPHAPCGCSCIGQAGSSSSPRRPRARGNTRTE